MISLDNFHQDLQNCIEKAVNKSWKCQWLCWTKGVKTSEIMQQMQENYENND